MIALVTGGASGIGAATVELLQRSGATVVIADIGGSPSVDVTDEAAVDALVAAVVGEHGRLDVAVNAAGVSGWYAPVVDADTEQWRRTLEVNLLAVFFCLRAELRAMRTTGSGSIVNVASAAALMGVPNMAAYAASKHAVVGLTRSAALEVARDGVRVNAVCPGTVRTPMLEAFVGGDEATLERMGRANPMGRLADPREVAEAIVWLCSDAASFVTGHSFSVDGGVCAT
jgi:NAD(P)-dependent dehydrogenase (short-subunit alcohol dehydrogenase family)